jgi:NADH-quinone oxidoreductase subunit A
VVVVAVAFVVVVVVVVAFVVVVVVVVDRSPEPRLTGLAAHGKRGEPGMASYVPILMIMGLAAVVAIAMYTLATVLGPKAPNEAKPEPFECGNPSDGARKIRPSVKFYLTALLFVVFDIEAVMIYPWAVEFRALGWAGFATMASFIALLAIVLVYAWRKGALEWER